MYEKKLIDKDLAILLQFGTTILHFSKIAIKRIVLWFNRKFENKL